MTTEEKLDVVEVSDEIVRQSRYGKRNYRNSIGEDNRRHWHGDFIVERERVELDEQEVDAEVFDEIIESQEEPTVSTEETVEDVVEEPTALNQIPEADEEAIEEAVQSTDVNNIVDVDHNTFEEDEQDYNPEELANFMDPLSNVDGLEEVISEVNEDAAEETTDVSGDSEQDEEETDADERTDTVPERE